MGNRINAAVEEIIRKFVKNPKFEEEIRKLIGGSIDTSELDREYDGQGYNPNYGLSYLSYRILSHPGIKRRAGMFLPGYPLHIYGSTFIHLLS